MCTHLPRSAHMRSRRTERTAGGFTLAETLLALVLFVVLAAVALAGVQAAARARESSAMSASASLLGSQALNAVAEELRFGQEIMAGGDSVMLTSARYGVAVTIRLDENGRLIVPNAVQTVVTNANGDRVAHTEDAELLSEGVYGALSISDFNVTNTGDGYRIYICVSNPTGSALWQGETTVVPLNG